MGLAENGICGIVIGLDCGHSRADSRRRSRWPTTSASPILLVPYSVGFAAIGRAVAGGAGNDDSRRIAVTERVYQVIRQSVASPGRRTRSPRWSATSSCRLAVLDAATGEVALDSSDPVPDDLRRVLTSEISARRGAVPGVLHVGAGTTARWSSRCPTRSRQCWSRTRFAVSPPDVVHLQHLASAMAVLLAQQNVRREHERRIGAEVMASLCDGRMQRRSRPGTRRARSGRPTWLRWSRSGRIAATERQLHVSLGRRSVPHLLLRRATLLYALMPITDRGHSPRCATASAARRGNRCQRAALATRPAPTAVREATWAVRVADTTARPDRPLRRRDDAVRTPRHRGGTGRRRPGARHAHRLRRSAFQRYGRDARRLSAV